MMVHNTPASPIIRGQSVAALDQEYSVPPQLMPIKNNVVLVVLIVIPAQSMESSRSLIVVLGLEYRIMNGTVANDIAQKGRLIRKSHRQVVLSTMSPPMTGAMLLPRAKQSCR